jgi:hypothetical protein
MKFSFSQKKKRYTAVKLDMRKTYGWVEWSFLEAMMRALGFEEKWITLIMICLKSVSYPVLVNGMSYGKIQPSRGLRQADLLLPYLFLIVAEGLSSLLTKAELDTRITRVPISVGGQRISHLFFTDDSLLFYRANVEEWGKSLPSFAKL